MLIHFGKFITPACKKQDKNRISITMHKSSGSVKGRRKKLSAIRKEFCGKEKKEKGGESYFSGAC